MMRAIQAPAELKANFRTALAAPADDDVRVTALMQALKLELGVDPERSVWPAAGLSQLQQIWDHGYQIRRCTTCCSSWTRRWSFWPGLILS